MKNPNDTLSTLVSALLNQGRVFDDKAETVDEIADKLKLSANTVRRMIKTKSGKIEQVWKRVNGKPFLAYRVKK